LAYIGAGGGFRALENEVISPTISFSAAIFPFFNFELLVHY